METWQELNNEYSLNKDEGEENLELLALLSSDTEHVSTSDSEPDEEDDVFSNLSRFDLISFIQDLMSRCQDKAKDMKTSKKQNGHMKEELKSSQDKIESLEKDHIAQLKEMTDKSPSEHEMALQNFIMTGLERTKLASIIYGIIKIKGKGMGYS